MLKIIKLSLSSQINFRGLKLTIIGHKPSKTLLKSQIPLKTYEENLKEYSYITTSLTKDKEVSHSQLYNLAQLNKVLSLLWDCNTTLSTLNPYK